MNAEKLVAVHTHTHTHTVCNLIDVNLSSKQALLMMLNER